MATRRWGTDGAGHPGTPPGGPLRKVILMKSSTWNLRRGAVAVVGAVMLCALGVACEPRPLPTTPEPAPGQPAARASLDTFVVSSQPTATRDQDVVLRVMGSDSKTKIALVSFPVSAADTSAAVATVAVVARQSGFALDVHNAAPFTAEATFSGRPELGARVGSLPATEAGARHEIPLQGVQVVAGQVHLAFTTSGPYELELVSTEGAAQANAPERAPALVLDDAPPPGSSPSTVPPATAPAPTTAPPATPAPSGWRLTFSDEFNGSAVDASKWNVYDQRENEWVESPKASTCARADNVWVAGGKLVMRTQKANGSCTAGQAQSGAGMNTWGRFQQAGGRFVTRGRWTDRGNYLWGGFWTAQLGKGGDNPSEIDTWEYIGKNAEPNISRFKPAIHFNYTCEGTCGMQNLPYAPYDVTAWHEYAVEWEPTVPSDPTTMQIRFYVDGRQIAQFDKHGTWRVAPDGTKTLQIAGGWRNPRGAFPNPFGLDRPHHLILSAWVGGPGVDAATIAAGYRPAAGHADLEIDYVRVYAR